MTEESPPQPTIVLIGGLPVVLKAPMETLKLATQAALAIHGVGRPA